MNGDEIGAVTAPVVVTLKDGSRVTLTKGSKAMIEEKDGKSLFRLLAGTGEYLLGAKSNVSFYLKDKAAPAPAGSTGTITLESKTVTGTRVKAALLPPPPPVLSSR